MKKVLKIIGRIIAVLLCIILLPALVTLGWGIVQRNVGKVMDIAETPDSFVPEVRLVLFTDTHNKNDRVSAVIDKVHEMYDGDSVYAGIDGIFNLGDFTSIGNEDDYEAYIAETDACLAKYDDLFVTLVGNHEMKRKDYADVFDKEFGYEPNKVYNLNGFSVIAFSGERSLTEWTFTADSLKWLSEAVKTAESEAGDKPVIVLQHPHPFGTVYGSTVWCDPQINVVLNGHNKVVDFSGHSHFPMNDPRSINQSSYTSVGVGAMARFELDKNLIPGQHPDYYEDAWQFCVVEADSNGAVHIIEYDMNTNTVFNDYFIENVNDKSTYCYTFKNMKAHDTTPEFKELAVTVNNGDDNCVVEFSDAVSESVIHHYNVKITGDDGTVYSGTIVNDYYKLDSTTSRVALEKGALTAGKNYKLEIVAVSAYGNKSEKTTAEFTA